MTRLGTKSVRTQRLRNRASSYEGRVSGLGASVIYARTGSSPVRWASSMNTLSRELASFSMPSNL